MKKVFDTIAWVILFAFAIPTTLVIASWNSLPGDNIYPVKLALEKTLLVLVSPSYSTSGTLQVKYTERRFSETQRLLAEKHSVAGLPYLTQQVETAKVTIEKAPNSQSQQVLTQQYITTLTQVSAGLEQQKQSLITSAPSQATVSTTTLNPPASQTGPLPTPTPTAVGGTIVFPPPGGSISPPVKPTLVASPTPASTTAPTASVTTTGQVSPETAVVALQITQTQQVINQTITELEEHQKEEEKKDNQGQQQFQNQPEQKARPDNSTSPESGKSGKNSND